ncbi:hypothetical protein BVC80_8785g10 [Macleaya cordata]|uniref:DUF4408 domain-containing protein n=1 Tax=Macleaya cordata TaxID=56857 RepID=A0A200PVE9_MACCD|nr:hypothetical protein BVC80_8785g10 [Macleaya cordata]
MDQIMYQNLQTAIKLSKSQFLKKSIQFLLKLSIFSFIFSYFSWPAIFLHCINLYSSSTFPHPNIDRNYMFLICIGILVFVARNSGLISSSPFDTYLEDEFSERIADSSNRSQIEFSEMKLYVEKEEEEEDEDEDEEVVKNVLLITQGEEEEEEHHEDEEKNHELLSTEELQKKCDDFIKKIKENIRIEAQQLIMV